MYRSELNKKRIQDVIDMMIEESELLPLIHSKEEVSNLIARQIFDADCKSIGIVIGFDTDGTCFLKGCADIEGFSGYGEGWFNISDITTFIDQLSSKNFPLELAGGYYGEDHKLKHKNFCLKFTEIGTNGTYSLAVGLKNHPETGCRDESIMVFSSELILGKIELEHVTSSFREMINSGKKSFVITGR